jgi:outer membrane protein
LKQILKTHYRISLACLTIIFIMGIGPLQAQRRILNLNEAITTSLQNNFDIQLTRNDSLLAALDYNYSKYALFPRLNAGGGIDFITNNQKQVLADNTKRERNGIRSNIFDASINLDWTLFDGLRMFIARDRLKQLQDLGSIQIKAQVITTVAEVMRNYFDIVRQEQQLKAIEEQIQLSQERLTMAQYKLDVGTGAKPDVLQARVDLNALRSAHLSQQNNINKTREILNQLMVLPVGSDFGIADTTIAVNTELTLDSIQGPALLSNPELLIAQQNLLVAQTDVSLRKAERFPTLEFNSSYNYSKIDNKDVINPFQSLYNRNHGFNYGFTATIPIFNGLNTKRQIKSAEIIMESAKVNYDRNVALLGTSIANAYRDYDLYKRTLALEEENIQYVRENIYIARERYRLGISTFLEMREAQRSLLDATTRLIQARYNTKLAEIELLRLRGDLVK